MNRACVLMVAAIALAGCSSDVCGDEASATQAVGNKFASCAMQTSGCFFTPCFDQSACETSLKSCTTADRAVLEASVSCQNTYANSDDCSFVTYDACASSATKLSDGGSALSPACSAAFTANPGVCVDGGA